MKKGNCFASRRLGARGHAVWGTGAGAVLGAVRFRFVTVRDGRVLGDVSGAGAGAALGCYWSGVGDGAAHMDGRVLGRVLFGVSWLSHHHDAGRSIMMLSGQHNDAVEQIRRCCCSSCRAQWFGAGVSSSCCQPRHDASAIAAMPRYGSWVWWWA